MVRVAEWASTVEVSVKILPWMSIPNSLRHVAATSGQAGLETGGLVVTAVAVNEEEHFRPSVTLTLDAGSIDLVAAFTGAHIGVRVQVLVDGDVVSEPRISTPIVGGVLVLTMGREREAVLIAERLRAPGAVLSIRIAH